MVPKNVFAFIACLILSFNALASEPATRASVEKLLEVTESSKMIDTVYAQVDSMSSSMATQMGVTGKDRPAFDRYMKKVSALMRENMNWEKLKEPMIEVYVKHFTEREVQGMIDFYSSDVGKSAIKKMPLVMQDAMGVSQKMMEGILPQIKVLAEELAAEIKATKAQPEEKSK